MARLLNTEGDKYFQQLKIKSIIFFCRAEAFDEDDTHRAVPICDTNSSATEVGNGSVCGVSGSVGAPGVLKLNGQAGQTTADAGAPAGSTATAATSAANRAGDITGQPATTEVIFDYNDGYDSTADMTSEATTTTKNTNSVSSKTMISSFVTVIEGTKDLSLRDQEKQRSPQHAPSSTASEASSEVLDETGGQFEIASIMITKTLRLGMCFRDITKISVRD